MNTFDEAYFHETTMNPLGVCILLACCVAVFALSRRKVLWAVFAASCFISEGQRLNLLAINFDALRVIVLCVWVRLFVRGEVRRFRFSTLDKFVIVWHVGEVLSHLVKLGTNDVSAALGWAGDGLAFYFGFRILIRDIEDVLGSLRGISLIAVPVAICFLIESITAKNMFSAFGGVPQTTMIRDGRLRCQGAFSHPIIAGCFWASLLPLLASQFLWRSHKYARVLSVVSSVCALVIISACASATPYLGVACGLLGCVAFAVRRHVRSIWWGTIGIVIVLHFVMNNPVWHLITQVNIVGGSSSYQRFQLIDGAINHYSEWWIDGSTVGTAHWGWACYDCCDYYVVQGLHGGIPLLASFIFMLRSAFRTTGESIKAAGNSVPYQMIAWTAGVCIFVHCVDFIGLSYFGQMPLVFALNLAVVAGLNEGLSFRIRRTHPRAVPRRDRWGTGPRVIAGVERIRVRIVD
jgi:hypothetical protein